MRATFHLKTLAVAIATISVASMTNAAGLDRSGQDVTAFFQDGTYAEAVYTYIDADVSGKDSANNVPSSNTYVEGGDTGDIAEAYLLSLSNIAAKILILTKFELNFIF